jgi:hypothetical protein
MAGEVMSGHDTTAAMLGTTADSPPHESTFAFNVNRNRTLGEP